MRHGHRLVSCLKVGSKSAVKDLSVTIVYNPSRVQAAGRLELRILYILTRKCMRLYK